MSKHFLINLLLFLLLLGVIPLAWNCDGSGRQYENVHPIARLSNIPPTDSFTVSKSQIVTLSWVGDDPDGYVVGFRYRWSFRANSLAPFEYKPWSTILNIRVKGFALMTDADFPNVRNIHLYFATLPQAGLDTTSQRILNNGGSVIVAGAHVWASNPDSNIVRYPVHTNPNKGTFIFDSPDLLNPHTFEVEAIDNSGDTGAPAKVSFGTPIAASPHSEIITFPTDTQMVIDHPTGDLTDAASFHGVHFEFRGFDENSRTIEFSWVVDKDQWPAGNVPWSPFSQTTSIYVTGKDFPDHYATDHTLYVRARNEFGVIDTVGYFLRQRFDNNNNPIIGVFDTVFAKKAFVTLYPLFLRPGYDPRILVLNMGRNCPESTLTRPRWSMVDDYYRSMLDGFGLAGKYDVVDAVDDRLGNVDFPGRGTVAKYSTILFVADAITYRGIEETYSWYSFPASGNKFKSAYQKIIEDYAYIGGKLIISAWAMPWITNADGASNPALLTTICHTQDNGFIRVDTLKAFVGAFGEKGYPAYIALDTNKVEPGWWKGGLRYIFGARPYGFGERIFTMAVGDPRVRLYVSGGPFDPFAEGSTVGVRYLGVGYDVIYFAFPLYYMEQPAATQVLRKALVDINALTP
jgi:hypothetical protein